MTDEHPPGPAPADEAEHHRLRVEIDRLRLQNQAFAAKLEDVSTAPRWLKAYGAGLWRRAARQYWIARWHLTHVRDPRRGWQVRDVHAPYVVRVPPPAAGQPRVLHVIGNFHTGGSARLVVDLIERLGGRFRQDVLVRSLPPAPAYVGVELIHRPRLDAASVRRILRERRPDLVHVHMLGHQHDEYGRRDWSWYHAVFQGLAGSDCPVVENLNIPVEPYVSPSVRCYVHVSDYVRARFGRLDAWNVTIHPGSDLSFFRRRPDQPVPDDCLGMVYRLQSDKLDASAIEPFIAAVRRRPGTRALIVGGGMFLNDYQRRVAEAGLQTAFTFAGYVPYAALPEYFARMSVFVAPVHTESFGQVSPFAMGMSLPVAGYRVGALEEITDEPALLAPPGDAARLGDILVDLLDDRDRRLRIGARNRQRAEALFSTDAMIAAYDAVYTEVLRAPLLAGRPRPAASSGAGAPLVSVVMAVHDGAAYLRDAIQSVLGQRLADLELLVIDDGSTDGSGDLARAFGDPRVRVLENPRQLGLSQSLNRGIAEARGRYVARLDADDIAEPDRLLRQVDHLERHPDVVLVGSWNTIIDADGREIGRRFVPADDLQIRWMLQFCSPLAHSAATMRTAVLRTLPYVYDERLVYAMDYDLWRRLADAGRLANVGACLVRWRTWSGAMTSRLGDRTERLDRVAGELTAALGWPAGDGAANERKADLICAIVAGQTPACTAAEVRDAVRDLFRLHDRFCAARGLDAETTAWLGRELTRHVARAWQWFGHQYPDARDHRFARQALAASFRLDAASALSGEGLSLAAKVLGGAPLTAAVRRLSARR